MKLYRIVTENIHFQGIVEYLKKHKLDATIINANGLWQGGTEKSIVVEIVRWPNNDYDETAIEKFVYWLKKHNKQDKVMLQEVNAEIWLL